MRARTAPEHEVEPATLTLAKVNADVTVAISQRAAREIVILLGEYLFVPVARLSGAPRAQDPTERPLLARPG